MLTAAPPVPLFGQWAFSGSGERRDPPQGVPTIGAWAVVDIDPARNIVARIAAVRDCRNDHGITVGVADSQQWAVSLWCRDPGELVVLGTARKEERTVEIPGRLAYTCSRHDRNAAVTDPATVAKFGDLLCEQDALLRDGACNLVANDQSALVGVASDSSDLRGRGLRRAVWRLRCVCGTCMQGDCRKAEG